MYGWTALERKRTNVYVLRSTGNAYDVISHRRLSGPRAPNILDKSTPMCGSTGKMDKEYPPVTIYIDVGYNTLSSIIQNVKNALIFLNMFKNVSLMITLLTNTNECGC